MNLVEALNTGKWFRRKGHSVAYRYDWIDNLLYFAVDFGDLGVCEDPVFMTHEIVATNWVKNYKPKYFDVPGHDGGWITTMSDPDPDEPYYDPEFPEDLVTELCREAWGDNWEPSK